ncbi:GNAT family N-acetyltransferase [Niveispirillum sp. KHB5.9]|uniref:GNAT family N-acetyltransferase n=1 Tax=Niveispirillum sp. KHB5.9 TaxID=3400269 RepID=UPI003A889354
MAGEVSVRTVVATDRTEWRALWDAYCTFYKVQVPERVTETLWCRILDPVSPVNGLVAVDAQDRLLGLCHYVLHPHTWSAQLLCYLEDLFTAEAARGQGVGRALINRLVGMGSEAGWGRVYWHTETDNARARILYDKVSGGADPYVRYTIRPGAGA